MINTSFSLSPLDNGSFAFDNITTPKPLQSDSFYFKTTSPILPVISDTFSFQIVTQPVGTSSTSASSEQATFGHMEFPTPQQPRQKKRKQPPENTQLVWEPMQMPPTPSLKKSKPNQLRQMLPKIDVSSFSNEQKDRLIVDLLQAQANHLSEIKDLSDRVKSLQSQLMKKSEFEKLLVQAFEDIVEKS